ncbi:MAG: hypothetical protein IJ390_06810 [Lachnospiraceae bacterium]|nr:hypothetical protein [Lachnospiraceae bacterium]
MATPNYVPIEGTIQSLSSMQNSCCNQLITLATGSGIVTFTISGETYIVDNQRLRRGMRVMAFYDANLPVLAIFPPRYQAQMIAPLSRGEMASLNFFDRNLLARDNSLQLLSSPATTITTSNGQAFSCSPGNHLLLVFYSVTTRSIPPQTTPRRIIVFC